jgi:hypothetical protein
MCSKLIGIVVSAAQQPQCTPTAERLSVGSSRLFAAGDWER